MTTYASRPAWDLRSVTRARLAVPLGLAALTLLSLALRTNELGIGFWIDEGLSVGISDRPLSDIPHALRLDGSPPLYYLLLHVWMSVFGTSEEAVRAMSLVCALAAVPVAFWAANMLFGARAGWMAAVLSATNPFLTRFAQEGRMYALLALLAMIACAAFGRAFTGEDSARARRPWAIALAVTLAAMLYTHNWALFFATACGVVWLFLLFRARGERAARSAHHRPVRVRRRARAVPAVGADDALPGGPHRSAVVGGADRGRAARVARADARLVRPGGADPRGGRGPRRSCGRCVRGSLSPAGRAAACLLAIGLLTVVLAWISSQLSPAWANRYLAVGVSPLLLVAGAGLAYAGRLGIAGLIVAAALGAGQTAPDDKSNVRDVAEAIGPSLRAGDVVLSTQPEQVSALRYYLPKGVKFATLTGPVEDSGVTDWRDGTKRLGATSAPRDLKPVLDAMKPGQRLALVQPIIFDVRRWQAPWTELVRLRSAEWSQYLSNDPRFSVAAQEPELPIERRPNPVQATVVVKTRD